MVSSPKTAAAGPGCTRMAGLSGGDTPTAYRGQRLQLSKNQHAWTPQPADPTAAATERTHAYRALVEASSRGDLAGIEAAVAAGVDIDHSGLSGWAPLHRAAERGRVAAVQLMLKSEART